MRYPAVEPIYCMVPRLFYSCVFTDETACLLQRLLLAQLVLKAGLPFGKYFRPCEYHVLWTDRVWQTVRNFVSSGSLWCI